MRQLAVEYEADGIAMCGQLLLDESASGRRPGVLVFPEGFGLAQYAIDRARALAELGYVALACDLHGGGRRIVERDEIMRLLEPLRQADCARARAKPAFDALLGRPEVDPARIAAVGYCMGGALALELARSGAELAGVVGFHSTLATTAPQDACNITGKILVCLGADDPTIDLEQRRAFEDEMRAARVNWQMNLYGGAAHAFTNADAEGFGRSDVLRYDAQADTRSWTEMCAFLREVFAAQQGCITPGAKGTARAEYTEPE